jgi:hypothetical protein
LLVVFVPSLCWVVDVVLDCPSGFAADVVLVCFDGSLVFVVLLFWPSGFSVVVVVELDWANAPLPSPRLSPIAMAAIVNVERIGVPPCGFVIRRSPPVIGQVVAPPPPWVEDVSAATMEVGCPRVAIKAVTDR